MLLTSAIVLACVVTPILGNGNGNGCRDHYKEVNGRCFRYEKHKRSYDDAQTECKSEGADLGWFSDFTGTIAGLNALDFDHDFWIGGQREEDDIVRPNGERLSINAVGFWGKGQPKDKKDYQCLMVKPKKRHGHHGHKSRGKGKHHENNDRGLEWELKKCKDKKAYLCEQKCKAGLTYCGGELCVSDPKDCTERPPLFSCDADHDFSVDGPVFKSTGFANGKYPANSVCVYKLSTEYGYILKLRFDEFSMGTDDQDFIEVFVGSTTVASSRFYGRFRTSDHLVNRHLYSINNKMIIVLKSDGRTSRDGRGFSLTSVKFATPPSVEGEIISVIGIGKQFIKSPGFSGSLGELPGYEASWTFMAPPYSQIIFELDVETRLDRDSEVEILGVVTGDEYVRIAKFKGSDTRYLSFISTTNVCVVRYRTGSGAHWFSRGFKITYYASTGFNDNCRQDFKDDYGVVTSPGYGTYTSDDGLIPYAVNYRCTYSIIVSSNGGNFSFWFDEEFGIDVGDKLEINNVGINSEWEIVGYVDNTEYPDDRYTAFGLVTLTFITNAVTNTKNVPGFKVSYSRDCPVLVVSEWTELSQSIPYQYENEVDIKCKEGYEFQDNGWSGSMATVECLMGGVWNVSRIPTCQPVYCGTPPTIKNGHVQISTGVLFGDMANYICNEGLQLIGLENVTCQANKNWTSPPQCSEISCSLDQPIDGISSHVLRKGTAKPLTNSTYEHGAVVGLHCIDGYYVEGVQSIYCMEDTWNNDLGSCERISCPFVPVRNGVMTSEATEPSLLVDLLMNVTYFYKFYTDNHLDVPSIKFEQMSVAWCRPGFVINGTASPSANAMCMYDGLFDMIPECVDYNECEDNVCEQHCINTPGSYECKCDNEYQLNSDNSSCILIPGCEANPGACDQVCDSVALHQWFECSCVEPYVLYDSLGAHGWYKHNMDTADGLLRVNQSCVLPQCPLESIAMNFTNTVVLAHYNDTLYPHHYNDTVKVMCSRGYTYPDGDRMKEFTCGMAGQWNDSMGYLISDAMCSEEVTCNGSVIPITGVPFSQPHVQDCGHPFGFQIISYCDLDPENDTYMLFSDALCPEIDCGPPDLAHTLGSTNITTSCTTLNCSFEFACDGGSEPLPSGTPATIVCMDNGKWNYSNIYCEGTTCSDPGTANGVYKYASEEMDPTIPFAITNMKRGGKLYYDCIYEGYTLFNNNTSEIANHTTCNGEEFEHPLSHFVCIDTEHPVVSYCPAQIDVFRYEMFRGAPFNMGNFMGYGSPHFTDNTGISAVRVIPYTFHYNYIFDEDINVTFTATDFEDLSETCEIEFLMVDPVPPQLVCTSVYVKFNETYPEVNVTADMVLSAVHVDNTIHYEYSEVVIAASSQVVNKEKVQSRINLKAEVIFYRVFFSGDVSLGLNRSHNITMSSRCSVSIIPEPDLCAYDFAPTPDGADRHCEELDGSTRRCNYTCQDPNALFFQYSGNLMNTAESQCSNSSLGYAPVLDCIVSGYAVARTYHAINMVLSGSEVLDVVCYDKFLAGYEEWIISAFCKDAVANISFSNSNRGADLDLATLLQFSNTGVTGFAIWKIVGRNGLRGAELICNAGSPELRHVVGGSSSPIITDLSSIDDCLSSVSFLLSSISQVEFICEDEQNTPIEIGQTLLDNVTYPYFSCFNCPAGTYLKDKKCLACPIGTFTAEAGIPTECDPCPLGIMTTVAEGSTTCSFYCLDGYVSENGVYPCEPCPVGTYAVNTTYCMTCSNGTVGRSNAQNLEDSACKAMCPPGTYSHDGYAPAEGDCMECPVNFFQPNSSATLCIQCPEDEYTNNSTGQSQCISFMPNCPSEVTTNCSQLQSCKVKDGMFFCTNGCEDPTENHGILCNIPTTTCDKKLCDPRGTIDCQDGVCICNDDIATGEFCDIMISPADPGCMNSGESFSQIVSYVPGAGISVTCLCSAQWSGAVCTEVEDKCLVTSPCAENHFDECVNEDVRARCDCSLGYMGYRCEIDIDGCVSSPCMNGGTCNDVNGTDVVSSPYEYTCDCPPGFSGHSCQFRKNECDDISCGVSSLSCFDDYMSLNSVYCFSVFYEIVVNATISVSTTSFCQSMDIICWNGGSCVDVDDPMYRYKCECPDIYDGQYCQHRIDFCEEDPCVIGNCANRVNAPGYLCDCPFGYQFSDGFCKNINECQLGVNLCNTGKCIDTDGSFYCVCDEEYAGQLCGTNIDKCLFNTCYGDGECQDTADDYMCHCQGVRTGRNCLEEVNKCTETTCQNNGICHPLYDDFICQCQPPSYGRHCEHLPDVCETERPCVYGGQCEVDDFSYTCNDCDEGYFGNSCELWVNECTFKPCKFGGICRLNSFFGYTCDCPAGYAGDQCELLLDPCSHDPCPEATTCVRQGFLDYSCVCPAGFVGSTCTTLIDANFDFYVRTGEFFYILEPTESRFWTITKFTISAWVRPDRIMNDDNEFIDFIHLTVDEDVILRINAHAVMFNGVWYNISSNPDNSLAMGHWAFYGVSVDTVDDETTITVYANGLAVDYTLDSSPEEKLGRLNIRVSPNREFIGFCSQVYLWAGASFSKREGALLNQLLTLARGQVIQGDLFKDSYIHYFWAIGVYRTSPFCEIGRPTSYCTTCEEKDIGTFLEFERECPDNIVVTTSSSSASVEWLPPKFLANNRPLTANPPNIEPGTVLGLGRHEVRYSASKNGKTLKCDFNIYVRFGCEGTVIGSRCYKPYEERGISKARAVSRCANFGGVLIEITNQDIQEIVVKAIQDSGLLDRQFMVGKYFGDDEDPQCVMVAQSNGDFSYFKCTNAVALICGRAISSTESCVLPQTPSSLELKEVHQPSWSRVKKYKLECTEQGYTLPSYAPREITCYPEGNWDTNFGAILPDCVLPAPPAIRYRVKIRIRFRIRIRNPCSFGGSYASYNILAAIRRVLRNRLRVRWTGLIRVGRAEPTLCCDDPNNCDTSASCRFKSYALSCRCSPRIFGKRRKRQAEENENEIDFNLDEIEGNVVDSENGGDELTAEAAITDAVSSGLFNDEIEKEGYTVDESEPATSSLTTSQESDCSEGYEPVDDECAPCSLGMYWTNGTCDFCPFNTYQNTTAQSSCTPCDGSDITYYSGSTSSDDCTADTDAGSFYNSDTGKVEFCPIGQFQPNTSQLACEFCPVGTTTIDEGSDSEDDCVVPCESGSEFDSEADLCVKCEIGYFRDALASAVCESCPEGFITEDIGAVNENNCSIVDCGTGTYRDVDDNTCMNCTRGTYQNETRATSCRSCGDNFTTAEERSTGVGDCQFICPDGYEELVAESCTACEVGTYRTKDIGDKKCTKCEQYWTTPSTGSTVITNCSILMCPGGKQSNATQDGCEDCPIATYSDMYTNATQRCESCPMDFTTSGVGTFNESDCLLSCPTTGEEKNSAGTGCSSCMQGYYAEQGEEVCKSCDSKALTEGMTRWDTVGNGSTSESNCTVALCNAGYKKDITSDPQTCVGCAIGSYQEENSSMAVSCTDCPKSAIGADQTTTSEKSTSVDLCFVTCPAGAQDVDDSCELCPVGTYKEVEGPAECTRCNITLTTDAVGSKSANKCDTAATDAGSFFNTATGKVELCPLGMFQANLNTLACNACPIPGTTTEQEGSDSEADCIDTCPSGSQHNSGLCIPCEIGLFKDASTSAVCEECPNGFTTEAARSVNENSCSIVTCPAGKQNVDDICESCPVGTYKNVTSPEECTKCNGTLTTGDEGSTSEDDCDTATCGPGFFSNGTLCEACTVGFYQEKNDFTGSECESCGDIKGFSKITASTQSMSEDDCFVDCDPGYEAHGVEGCVACLADHYDNGANICVPCADDLSTNGVEAITNSNGCSYTKCQPGEENNQQDTLVCDSCPRDKYNDDPIGGCQDCLDNRETISTRSVSPADCIINCENGTEYNKETDKCVSCAKGYLRVKNSDDYNCEECPADKTTVGTGESACVVPICPKGQFAKETNSIYDCEECEIGKYQANEGQLECVSCAETDTTLNIGSVDENSCVRKPSCEFKSPCVHKKHFCELINDKPVCSCPTAYVKKDFDCIHVCDRETGGSFCMNEGICNDYVDDISLACTCTSDWQGTNCSAVADPISRKPKTVLAIVGAISGVVLLAVVSAAVYACYKKAGTSVPKAKMLEPTYIESPGPPAGFYNTQGSGRLQLRDVEEFSPRGRPTHDSYIIQ